MLGSALILGLAGCGKKESKDDKLRGAISELSKDVFNEDVNNEDANNEDANNDYEESDDSSEEVLGSDVSETKEGTVLGEYISFESAANVFETFNEFGYEYVTKTAGEEPSSWSFAYKYLGSENINGVDTEHYQITMVEDGETQISEGWYDSSWSAVKYIDANGEQTGETASWAGSTLSMMTQMYCNQTAINLAIYSADGALDEFAYEILDSESQDMDFGFGNTNVEIINVKSKFADLIFHTGVANLNDKKFYVILDTETADGSTQGLHITNAITR
jgi:hypothetical protein